MDDYFRGLYTLEKDIKVDFPPTYGKIWKWHDPFGSLLKKQLSPTAR